MADAVAALLASPSTALIALDFDGTLSPIVERPESAHLASGALEVLGQLSAVVGSLAIISGRAASEVIALGELDSIPGLRVLGHYGMQSWQAGQLRSPDPLPAVRLAHDAVDALVADAPAGVVVEDKQHSIAVHTRRAADPAQALDDLTPALWQIADDNALEAVPGKFVVELRPPGIDKGTALRRLIEDLGPDTVIYVGDDLGDLPAFREVVDLREAGAIAGLCVAAVERGPGGVDTGPAEVRAQADLVLPGPEGVVGWLSGLLAMMR
ncbi:MAG: trehalose-phosphatase [Frankiaceae bacterium]|nr:trehalose-phosphatase [Frankiaceae bacterium]MBV9871101.1 trehalose-phosphatase [Frankiaceae bacterium]